MSNRSGVKNNLPPGLVLNLQDVLAARKGAAAAGGDDDDEQQSKEKDEEPSTTDGVDEASGKPIVFVTNADGIDSPGLTYLVQALVRDALYNVHVCAPQS